ncbi:hypothetical protein CFP56_043645 [Quercus suber]|uniref:Uncharacterized protein n=1 Tax=Quercus suber TaxID=58331 RepID=A0AAW0LK84_QUESU
MEQQQQLLHFCDSKHPLGICIMKLELQSKSVASSNFMIITLYIVEVIDEFHMTLKMSRGGRSELTSSTVPIVTLYLLGSSLQEQKIQMSYYDCYLKKNKS